MIVYTITNCPRGVKVLRDHFSVIIKFVRPISFTTTLKISSVEVT